MIQNNAYIISTVFFKIVPIYYFYKILNQHNITNSLLFRREKNAFKLHPNKKDSIIHELMLFLKHSNIQRMSTVKYNNSILA